jgi:hypothetical protein
MGLGSPPPLEQPELRDITQEFLTLDESGFRHFLWDLEDEGVPTLSIRLVWDSETMSTDTTHMLKAFSDSASGIVGQQRIATIVSTREEKDGNVLGSAGNVFSSGVNWEEAAIY